MALSVSQAFDVFLERLTPLQSERDAKTSHRASVEAALKASPRFGVQLTRETGSFTHGTGIRGHCDVDLLVSMTGQPGSSDTALDWVKDAMSARFPTTEVVIRRPTVVVKFAGGDETWEILPGFLVTKEVAPVYEIPGAAAGWMTTAPTAHLTYVNNVNQQAPIAGAAKKLARLAKAWKYYNGVPISSFYLEMRAAQHMTGKSSFVAASELCRYLEWLHSHSLADMYDPMGLASPFSACSSAATRAVALSNLRTAATRARKACDAQLAGNMPQAFSYLDLLFGGQFPKR